MAAIENMRRKTNDCTERVSQPELQISNAEDDTAGLQAKVNMLESKSKTLEDKLLDLETRSSLNNWWVCQRVPRDGTHAPFCRNGFRRYCS